MKPSEKEAIVMAYFNTYGHLPRTPKELDKAIELYRYHKCARFALS